MWQLVRHTTQTCLEWWWVSLHRITRPLLHFCKPVVSLTTLTSTSYHSTLKDRFRVSRQVIWLNPSSLSCFSVANWGSWCLVSMVNVLHTKSLILFSGQDPKYPPQAFAQAESLFHISTAGLVLWKTWCYGCNRSHPACLLLLLPCDPDLGVCHGVAIFGVSGSKVLKVSTSSSYTLFM